MAESYIYHSRSSGTIKSNSFDKLIGSFSQYSTPKNPNRNLRPMSHGELIIVIKIYYTLVKVFVILK